MKRREFLKRFIGTGMTAVFAPAAIANGILKSKAKLPAIASPEEAEKLALQQLNEAICNLWGDCEPVYEGGIIGIYEISFILQRDGEVILPVREFTIYRGLKSNG